MKNINKTPELEIVSIDNLQENIVSAVYSSEDWKEDLRKSFFVEDGAGNLFEVMPTFDEFKKTIVIWNGNSYMRYILYLKYLGKI